MTKPIQPKVYTQEELRQRYGCKANKKFVPLKRSQRHESISIIRENSVHDFTADKVEHVKKKSTDLLTLPEAVNMTPPESPKDKS